MCLNVTRKTIIIIQDAARPAHSSKGPTAHIIMDHIHRKIRTQGNINIVPNTRPAKPIKPLYRRDLLLLE